MLLLVLISMLCSVGWAQQGFNLQAVDLLAESAVNPLTPGLSLAIAVNNQRILSKAYGTYEVDRKILIASASKWLAAAVILTLVDDGRLRLDDRISRYIPSASGDKGAITVRQLLSHTSGLIGDSPCLVSRTTTLAACVDEILAEDLRFPPGSKFYYGNSGFQVAGRIAEIASGRQWSDLFTQKLTAPLEMASTRVDGVGGLENPTVANGVVSTASDYLNFLEMILDGGTFKERRVLSADSIAEMTRDQTNGVDIVQSIYLPFTTLPGDLPSMRYGLGLWREVVDSAGIALEVSSQGAFGFSPWVDFRRGLAGVLSVSSSQDAIMEFYLNMKTQLRRAVPPWQERTLFITNAASNLLGPLSPGTVFSVRGPGIGPGGAMAAAVESGRVSGDASGWRIQINGSSAPIVSAKWDEFVAVVPFAVSESFMTNLQIERQGEAGPRAAISVISTSPALYTLDGSGRGNVLAVLADGSLNSTANPAPRGSQIAVYATGLGQTQPALTDGIVVEGPRQVAQPIALMIGNTPAEIVYAGAAPGGIAGVYQINFVVPQTVTAGDALPISILIGNRVSPSGPAISIQ